MLPLSNLKVFFRESLVRVKMADECQRPNPGVRLRGLIFLERRHSTRWCFQDLSVTEEALKILYFILNRNVLIPCRLAWEIPRKIKVVGWYCMIFYCLVSSTHASFLPRDLPKPDGSRRRTPPHVRAHILAWRDQSFPPTPALLRFEYHWIYVLESEFMFYLQYLFVHLQCQQLVQQC